MYIHIKNIINTVEVTDKVFQGKFASSNAVNLSKRILFNAEISLLQKGLTFISTPISINKLTRLSLKLITERVKTQQLHFI